MNAAATEPTTTEYARTRELLLDNLFEVFGQHDRDRRWEAITRNYTEHVIWSDPEVTIHGREALHEGAQKLMERTPNFVFTAAGPVHALRDGGLLAFNLGVPEQPPAVSGYDLALVRDGQIAVLYTLIPGLTTG